MSKRIYLDRNLQIIFCVTLMAVLGVSSITPAFPRIVEALGISPGDVGLLITAFTLPGVILVPVMGILADHIGRKNVLVPSLMLFGISGGLCFLVKNFNLLLLLRFIQGVGAASLGSLNITIIGDLYRGRERAAAMGYNTSVLSLGTASYPIIGGALAMLSWNYPFLLSIAAIPIGVLVMFNLKNPEPEDHRGLREYLIGTLKNVGKPPVIGLLTITTSTFTILYGSYLTYLPLLMGLFEATPLMIGLIMFIMSFTTALTSSQLNRLLKRCSEKRLLIAASILYSLALITIPSIPNLYILTIPIIIFGVAHGLNIPVVQTLLTGMVPTEQRAAIMSINGMVLRLGQTLGPVITGVAYTITGIDGAFYTGAGFAAIILLISATLL